VEIEPFESLPAAARDALAAEGVDLLDFVAGRML
jgi:hypothetical protein